MSNDKVRLGIIGLGAEGGMYARFLEDGQVPNMRIGAVCDVLPAKKEQADAYGVPFYTDYTEMVTSGDVDAVVTTVPHYQHPEMGIYALEHGVHHSSRSRSACTPSRRAHSSTSPPPSRT